MIKIIIYFKRTLKDAIDNITADFVRWIFANKKRTKTMKYIFFSLCFISFAFLNANDHFNIPGSLQSQESVDAIVNQNQLNYIERYKTIAIIEMERTGVPASIKLAQGLLESASGTSELARNANNHFGMKTNCKNPGRKYKLEDDDYVNGKLVKSCFMVFSNPEDSWVGHSDFLRDPRKDYRYGWLFRELSIHDYKGWAHGLKKSGYATNPKYPKLLITLIERYNLDEFDKMNSSSLNPNTEVADNTPTSKPRIPVLNKKPSNIPAPSSTQKTEIFYLNNIRTTHAFANDDLRSIAKRTGIPAKKLKKYNEVYSSINSLIPEGSNVFLGDKKNSFNSNSKFHYVKDGETLADISQKYGVKVEKLAKRNKKSINTRLIKGEKIKLRGWNILANTGDSIWDLFKKKPSQELNLSDVDEHWMDNEANYLASNETTTTTFSTGTLANPTKDDDYLFTEGSDIATTTVDRQFQAKGSATSKPAASQNKIEYIVKKGDSLYGVAKKYNVKVNQIKEWNSLKENIIYLGQQLVIFR